MTVDVAHQLVLAVLFHVAKKSQDKIIFKRAQTFSCWTESNGNLALVANFQHAHWRITAENLGPIWIEQNLGRILRVHVHSKLNGKSGCIAQL